MTLEELRKEVFTAMQSKKPTWYRKGQFVFNYIDFEYGVARAVQFDDGIDGFYVDENIDAFWRLVLNVLTIKKIFNYFKI